MKVITLKEDREKAIGQLLNLQAGDHVYYSVGSWIGPHGHAMYWLGQRGHFALVQRAHGKVSRNARAFTYIAQRLESGMDKNELRKAFYPKER